jgi:outer membrane protein OmpA-like peptidoglycan-associated protein
LFAPKESRARVEVAGEDKPTDVPVYFRAGDATGKAENVEKTLNQRTNVVLEGITFQSGSYQLQKRAVDDLALIVNYLKQNPQSAIEVVAHTDDVGDTAENQLLSEKRAEAVRKFLVDSKIDGRRVTTRGMGETVPVFPNTTDENRAKNRRVEFRLK